MRHTNPSGRGGTAAGSAFQTPKAYVLALTILFSLCARAQILTVLHTFTGGKDGAYPFAGLVMDRQGRLYGTVDEGGDLRAPCPPQNIGCGLVYELAPSKSGWSFQALHIFHGGKDGEGPYGRVAIGPDGKTLYGTTIEGGHEKPCPSGCGLVFQLAPRSGCKSKRCAWQETVLYRFLGNKDGFYPSGDLTFDSAGNVYGTTTQGGSNGPGTVYELKPGNGGWTESIVWNFTGNSDGGNPYSGVIFDQAGNIYASDVGGGVNGGGAVIELSPSQSSWNETTLYDFSGASGLFPFAGLLLDPSGNLIGASEEGGQHNAGTAFELTPSGGQWNFTILYNFTAMQAPGPWAKLTLDAAGNLYGTTQGTPSQGDWGTVFKLTPARGGGWTQTILHSFTGGSDGGSPLSNVIVDAQGNLYGTTSLGGNGYGVVFEITP